MSLLTRYLFRHLALTALFATLALTMTIWVTQVVRLMDLVLTARAPLPMFVKMLLLTVPTFIGIIMPVALAGAVLFTYNKLTMDSELVVMRAVGLGPWRLARPTLILAGVIMVAVYGINLFASPAANRELVRLQYKIKNQYASVLIREGAFNDVGQNLTLYVRNRDDNGDLEGLLIYDTRNAGKQVTLSARRGALADSADGIRIVLADGVRQEMDLATSRLAELYFERYVIELQLFGEQADNRWPDARERSLGELLNPPAEIRAIPSVMRQFTAELHMRFATPLLPLSFAFITLACLLHGEYNRRGQGKRLALAAVLVILLQVVSLGLTGIASKQSFVGPLMYFIYLLPIVPCAWILSRR